MTVEGRVIMLRCEEGEKRKQARQKATGIGFKAVFGGTPPDRGAEGDIENPLIDYDKQRQPRSRAMPTVGGHPGRVSKRVIKTGVFQRTKRQRRS
jgi:hypothetical protein